VLSNDFPGIVVSYSGANRNAITSKMNSAKKIGNLGLVTEVLMDMLERIWSLNVRIN
jgi:hypothetical protein